ncbi:MAG TPA: colanic acid biosynthesis glycosyltransferase WcaI [Candidatus Scalindua sp.]|nr:colanic acid biosynthesis glycosyltransferase WcaI [Candidatus Scalindua sp.]
MNVLVMGMNYFPEKTAIGPFTSCLCEYLADREHEVTVVTAFPHYPEWRVHDGYQGKVFLHERINGILVYRSYVYVSGKPNTVQRIAYDSSFSLSAFVSGLLVRKVNIIVCISPPLQLGLMACILSKLKGVPFLFHIQDLLPDAAVNLGMLRDRRLVGLAHRLEKFIYQKAAAVGVISPGFAENLYCKGVPKSKVYYLPDWIDIDFIKPLDRNNIFRKQNNLPESDFLVMYAGNIGKKQALETVLDTASILRRQKDIAFFIVGEGAAKAALVNKAEEMNLSNVRFFPLQPKKMLPCMLSAADVLVLTQQAGITDICLPSKLLTNMASARPIVAGVNDRSETARAIRDAEAGLVVAPENAQAVAGAILRLRSSSQLREELGTNGRAFVSEHFEKLKVLKKFERLLQAIVQNGNCE